RNNRSMVSRGPGWYRDRRCVVWRLQSRWQANGDVPQDSRSIALQLSHEAKRAMGRGKNTRQRRAVFLRTWIELHHLQVRQLENQSRERVSTASDSEPGK